MESWALEIGGLYGFRENPRAATALIKVKLLDKVGRKGKLKIRFEDGPHPGLEEYVSSRQIIVSWLGRKAFRRDEKREAAVAEHAHRVASPAIDEAISAVLESSGESSAGAGGGAVYMAVDEPRH